MNKFIRCSLFLIALVFSSGVYTQASDLARIEYTYFPERDAMAESIAMTIILSGLGYQYNFTDHILFILMPVG